MRAAAATGLREEAIESFARLLAEGPTFLKIGPGAQRHADAGTGIRAAIMLPAVTGAWQHQGGGVLVHSAGAFAHPEAKMAKPELRGDRPQRNVNMVLLGRALAGTLDEHAPLTALVVYNSNPAVVVPDSQSVRAGLARDDLFTVVLEQFPTETVSYADVVLPATTQLEHLDAMWSWGHYYLTLNEPAIAPLGESRPNTEIFRMLAATMADDDPRFADKGFADDDEALLATYLAAYPDDIVEQLRDQGFAKLAVPKRSGSKIKLSTGAMPAPDGRDPAAGRWPVHAAHAEVTPLLELDVREPRTARAHGRCSACSDVRPGRRSSRRRRRNERAAAQRARRSRGRRRASATTCSRARSCCSRTGGDRPGRTR